MTTSEPTAQLPRALIPAEELQRRITELAAEIDRDYAGGDPILCIGVLKGSVFFMVDLLKQVETPLQIGFFQTSSYGSGTTAGEIRIRKDVDISVRDRDVLLIEDIVDTGYTLRTIMALLEFRGARSVKLCSLLDKVEAREVEIPIHYTGFQIENLFVVGYGLDLDERFRNLPYIGVWEGGEAGS
jgi:hypoxanthine phosphoribosyltransferase